MGRRCSGPCCLSVSELQGIAASVSHAFFAHPLQAGGCGAHGTSYTRVAGSADMVWPAEILQQGEQKKQGRALVWHGGGSRWVARPAPKQPRGRT